MKIASISLMFLTLMVGCNQNQSTKSEVESQKSDEIIGPIIIAQNTFNNGTKNGYGCSFTKLEQADELLAKKIVFSHELVETIIREIDNKDNIENFWSYLTLPTKQNLIYELTLNLLNFSKNTDLPFRSVAVFFGELAKSHSFSSSYLIREKNGVHFRFQVNGESIQEILSLDESCDQKLLSFSTIKISNDISSAADMSESFICRSNRDHFELFIFKDSLYFASRMDIIEVPRNLLIRKETNEEISLNIQENSEIKLKMKLNKRQFVTSQGRNAFKTKVKIESPTLDLSSTLTCERIIKN